MKSLIREMEEKFKALEESGYDNQSRSGVNEPNYIEVSVRDAKHALEIYADIARNFRDIVLYGSNVYASYNSEEIRELLDIFDSNSIEVYSENIEEDDLDEQNVTGAVAGFNTPAAFAKRGHWKSKSVKYESVNTPPTYKIGKHQKPESEEEEFNDKFPFADHEKSWYHNTYTYPSVNMSNTPNKTTKKIKAEDILEKKYLELVEGYREFATGNPKISPEKKVNETIRDIAKKLQEIETVIQYNARLKNESGISSSNYGNSTKKALSKISERLIKIAERVRALGE